MIETYDFKYHRGETLVDKPYQTIYYATTKFTPKDYVIINIVEKNNHVATVSKQVLEHSLMNVMQIDETLNNLAIITKKREGEPLEQYIEANAFSIDERIHFGFEYLKRLCNYEDLPTTIKYILVQPNQVLIQGDRVVMEEIIEIDESVASKDFKDIVSSIARVLTSLITTAHINNHLSPRCKDFIERMAIGNHHYQQFKDILHDYKRLFVFATIPDIAEPVKPVVLEEKEKTSNHHEAATTVEPDPIEDKEIVDIYIGTTPEEEEALVKEIEEKELPKEVEVDSHPTTVDAIKPVVSTVKEEIKVMQMDDDSQTMKFSKELTSKIDEVLDESSHIFDDVDDKATSKLDQADLLSDQAFEEYINKTDIASYDYEALDEETKYMPSLALDDDLDIEDDEEPKKKNSFKLTDKTRKLITYGLIGLTAIFLLWGLFSIGSVFSEEAKAPIASFEYVGTTDTGREYFKNTSRTFGFGNSIKSYEWKIIHGENVLGNFTTKDIMPAFRSPGTFKIQLRVEDSNGVWSEPFTQNFTAD